MPTRTRPQKITFAEMRESGVRGLIVYCADYRCSHSIAISGDAWPDDARLYRSAVCLPGLRQAGCRSQARLAKRYAAAQRLRLIAVTLR